MARVALDGMGGDFAPAAPVAGAMVGGLAEYGSMAVGFKYIVLIAILFYALSALGLTRESGPVLDQEPIASEM